MITTIKLDKEKEIKGMMWGGSERAAKQTSTGIGSSKKGEGKKKTPRGWGCGEKNKEGGR